MSGYTLNFPKGRLSLNYGTTKTPSWFEDFLFQFGWSYYYSAQKPKFLFLNKFQPEFSSLLTDFYRFNNLEYQLVDPPLKEKNISVSKVKLSKEKAAVMFTGGKDSLQLLLDLIEKYGKKNVIAIYVKNLNKSETFYETKSVEKICSHLGVEYRIVKLTNGVKLNRMNHNIGLRDQFILCSALPYIMEFGATAVYFGIHASFDPDQMDGRLYTESKMAFHWVETYLARHGVNIEVKNAERWDEFRIIENLVKNHRALLDMTSSCYTQMNFRENHHERNAKKFSTIPIYNGCGFCLKCARINGGIFLFDSDVDSSSEREKKFFKRQLVRTYEEKFPSDETLAEVVGTIYRRDNPPEEVENDCCYPGCGC